jgi:hypothetical protein
MKSKRFKAIGVDLKPQHRPTGYLGYSQCGRSQSLVSVTPSDFILLNHHYQYVIADLSLNINVL